MLLSNILPLALMLLPAFVSALPPPAPNALFRRAKQRCGPDDSFYAPWDGALQCYDFLRNQPPEQLCVSSRGKSTATEYCNIGGTKVVGLSWDEGTVQSSTCATDVLDAVIWILYHCSRHGGGGVAGWAFAHGNPGHEIGVLAAGR